MTLRTAIYPAILAAALTGAAASAAPIAPLAGATTSPAETVAFRGGNWSYHPLMNAENWREHQRQWNAREGASEDGGGRSCTRFRSYNRSTNTYVARNGRRVACP